MGHEYTKLNNGLSVNTMELGITIILESSLGSKMYRKREPCFVEDLQKASEWKAVEKMSKTARSWAIQYSFNIHTLKVLTLNN